MKYTILSYKKSEVNSMYDVAIIGTGAAGISAALTMQARVKSVLLIGSKNLSKKMSLAEKIRNYPGLGIVSGEEMTEGFTKHLQEMNIGIVDANVTEIYKIGDHFKVMCGYKAYSAYTIILAMGVFTANNFPGEDRLLGKGVSYCATCDGFLYSGKSIAVVSTSKEFEHEIKYLSSTVSKVYLIARYKDVEINETNVEMVTGKEIEICGDSHVDGIKLDGIELPVEGVFIMRDSIAPTNMMKGLKVDGSHIIVDRSCNTNIAGCYAAGDCTGRPYQYVKAAGEGNVSAHSALEYLAENKLQGNAKTRPYITGHLSFDDSLALADTSNLPTKESISGLVIQKLTGGRGDLVLKDETATAQVGDVIAFSAKGGQERFDRDLLRLTLGQNLYDYDVEKEMIGKKTAESFTIKKDNHQVEIQLIDIYEVKLQEPTDEMVQALKEEGITTVEQYTNKAYDEALMNEVYLITNEVVETLLNQEPEKETSEETIATLGKLELEYFDKMFKKQLEKGLYEMSEEELMKNLGVSSPSMFLEQRKAWYKMKDKQCHVLSKALGISLEGEYDMLHNYETLGQLQMKAVERIKAAVTQDGGK